MNLTAMAVITGHGRQKSRPVAIGRHLAGRPPSLRIMVRVDVTVGVWVKVYRRVFGERKEAEK
jgi:hypothetical protein